jgi:adenosylcobinamide-phosphate synthase
MVKRPQALAAAVGLMADSLLGEPPASWHPVAAYGSAMQRFEEAIYADRRMPGVAYAVAGVAAPALAGAALGRAGRRYAAAAVYLVVAGRALRDAAREIDLALRRGDIEQARHLLPGLVGRDPAELDADEIARAVVESVAENTVDAIVAPVFWTVVAGAPGAFAHRALNTLDAMVGHLSPRYARFGWAAAKADDAAAWLPARLTAGLVGLVRPGRSGDVWRAVWTQAPAHPSPNAGVAEAAFAAALDLRLGGRNVYEGRVEHRAELGTGRPASSEDIERAVRLCADVTVALTAGCLLVGTRR